MSWFGNLIMFLFGLGTAIFLLACYALIAGAWWFALYCLIASWGLALVALPHVDRMDNRRKR